MAAPQERWRRKPRVSRCKGRQITDAQGPMAKCLDGMVGGGGGAWWCAPSSQGGWGRQQDESGGGGSGCGGQGAGRRGGLPSTWARRLPCQPRSAWHRDMLRTDGRSWRQAKECWMAIVAAGLSRRVEPAQQLAPLGATQRHVPQHEARRLRAAQRTPPEGGAGRRRGSQGSNVWCSPTTTQHTRK